MDITITGARLGGEVRAIASKSHVHRLLICSMLAGGEAKVRYSGTSEDIDATARSLEALRSGVSPAVLPCGESGSTLRFLLPICCALGIEAELLLEGRLPQRPLSPLYEELTEHGAVLSPQGRGTLHVSGRLSGGEYCLPGNVSSQFISGLLFALPLLEEDSVLYIRGEIESQPYIDLTIAALWLFGIRLDFRDSTFYIPGRQKYASPGTIMAEGDWSNAAFWLCAGAIGANPVTCTGLNLSSHQGDMAVLGFLKRFGANVTIGADSVTVSRGELTGIHIDAANTPDLVPILAAVAAVANGRTVIYNAGRLRIKESDRLQAVTDTLGALGASIEQTDDGLVINGAPMLSGGTVSSAGDHRIAMTAAVAACRCTGAVTIKGAEAVRKSYPSFFEDYRLLGGTTQEG